MTASMPASDSGSRCDMRASADDRRDQILRSLASFMRDRKLASLSMSDITDRLGLVKGNLNYYFHWISKWYRPSGPPSSAERVADQLIRSRRR